MSGWFPTEWHLIMALVAAVGILIAIIGFSVGFGIWMGNAKKDQKPFMEFMDEFRRELHRIIARLPSPASIAHNGPVKLSEFGENISESLSVGKWAADHAERLKDDASGKPEFEIFQMCVEYVERKFADDPDFSRMVRKGAYEIGADMEQVRKVYEVELRDDLLMLIDSSTAVASND